MAPAAGPWQAPRQRAGHTGRVRNPSDGHHPEWAIHAQDEATRYTAEKRDGPTRHIVAHPSLKALLDRLDEIVAGR